MPTLRLKYKVHRTEVAIKMDERVGGWGCGKTPAAKPAPKNRLRGNVRRLEHTRDQTKIPNSNWVHCSQPTGLLPISTVSAPNRNTRRRVRRRLRIRFPSVLAEPSPCFASFPSSLASCAAWHSLPRDRCQKCSSPKLERQSSSRLGRSRSRAPQDRPTRRDPKVTWSVQ